MIKIYSKLLVFSILTFFSALSYAQTLFEFNNFTASGTNGSNPFEMTETVGSKSILVNALNGTSGVLITVNNLNGFGGTDGNLMRTNPATRVSFAFNEAVDVISIIALNSEASDGLFIFTPTGGNNTVMQALIANQSGQNVQLNWQGATGFSVVTDLGATSFFLDTLTIDENTLSREAFDLNLVTVHPNPTTSIINIKSAHTIKRVEIYDILGRKVKSTKSKTIFLDTFPKGIYIMKIVTNKGVVTKKITKI